MIIHVATFKMLPKFAQHIVVEPYVDDAERLRIKRLHIRMV